MPHTTLSYSGADKDQILPHVKRQITVKIECFSFEWYLDTERIGGKKAYAKIPFLSAKNIDKIKEKIQKKACFSNVFLVI